MSDEDRWYVHVDTPMGHEILDGFPTESAAMFFAVTCQEADPDREYAVFEAEWSKRERGES